MSTQDGVGMALPCPWPLGCLALDRMFSPLITLPMCCNWTQQCHIGHTGICIWDVDCGETDGWATVQ